MQAAYIVESADVAKVLVDPMRRAILSLLRNKPMTQAQLAEELGLSHASLNYHIRILYDHGLVKITKREAEEHGILQKFFSPSAYLYVYDLESIPKHLARYFYPISLERARAVISLAHFSKNSVVVREGFVGSDVNEVASELSRLLVAAAKSHSSEKVQFGDETITLKIYTEAFKQFLRQKSPSTNTS